MAWEYHKLEVAWASQPDATFPIWTDMTAYVEPAVDIVITRGRTSELDTIQPSTASWAFNNAKHWLTPGNPMSPWYPNVKLARKVRISETIDGITYYLFTGYLQFPEIGNWAKADATHPYDQIISMTAVDRLARLDRSRTLIGTLSEQIVNAGGDLLAFYWPMNEPSGSRVAHGASDVEPALPYSPLGYVAAGSETMAPGDDTSAPDFTDSGVWTPNSPLLEGNFGVGRNISISSTDTITIAAWVKPAARDPATTSAMLLNVYGVLEAFLGIDYSTTPNGLWNVAVYDGAWGVPFGVNGPGVAFDSWHLVALRFGLRNAAELWVGATVTALSLGAGAPASSSLGRITVSPQAHWSGSVAHIQIYKSSATADYTWAMHLEQLNQGYTGLGRQTVNQRITTLAQYAGLAATDLQLDSTSGYMPRATLAGEKPSAEMRTAADTEGGLLFVDGQGRIVLHARSRRYNPVIAATVDLSWLAQPWQQRLQPPINAASVSRTDGSSARSRNRTSAAEYGDYENPGGGSLETAVNGDPAALAKWLTYTYPAPRQRAQMLAMDLIAKTPAQLHTILAREISDRFAISGLPSNAPEGVGAQHIEGITHRISPLKRRVEWNTSPVLGQTPGVPDVWPVVGTAVVGSSTLIPY